VIIDENRIRTIAVRCSEIQNQEKAMRCSA
jgi:hypothetical protein